MKEVNALLALLIEEQQKKLLECGRERIPNLTSDDILQPNDYPLLEQDPLFRYEEGLLAGMQTVQSALYALWKEMNL